MTTNPQRRRSAECGGNNGPTTITLAHKIAIIEPHNADSLGPLLTYQSRSLNYDPSGRGQWLSVTTRLYDREENGSLCVPAGAVPRIVRHLREQGHEVLVHDRRRFPNPSPINELLF